MKDILKEILSTSIYLLCVLLFTFLLVKFVVQRTEVIGSSMEPMLYDKENLLVEKISYRFKDPERYDIIIFPHEDEHFIKRIIGLPGETVYIDKYGAIFINGEILKESYGKEIIKDPGVASEKITLGNNEYFVLGDNRNNSMDSRSAIVGNVTRKDIVGKAWVRIWPFNKFTVIKHR